MICGQGPQYVGCCGLCSQDLGRHLKCSGKSLKGIRRMRYDPALNWEGAVLDTRACPRWEAVLPSGRDGMGSGTRLPHLSALFREPALKGQRSCSRP